MAFWLAIATLMVPGLGQGMISQRRRAIAWAASALVSLLAILLSVWLMYGFLALRLACAIDAFIQVRRAGPKPTWNTRLAVVAAGFAAATLIAGQISLEGFRIPSSSMYPALEIGDHIYVDKLTPRWRAIERGELIVFDHPCQPERQYTSRAIAVGGDTVEIRCDVVHVNGEPVASELVDADCKFEDRFEGDRSETRRCSRYRETLDGRSYEVFHDPDRPARDDARRRGGPSEGTPKDFPREILTNCANTSDPAARSSNEQAPGRLVDTANGASPCELRRHFVVPPDSIFVLGNNRPNSNDSRYWGVVPTGLVKGRLIGVWWPLGRLGAVR